MKKLFISLAIIAGISLSGCNDSFLEKSPVTDLTCLLYTSPSPRDTR